MLEMSYPFINNYPVIPYWAKDSETFSISLLLQDDVFLTVGSAKYMCSSSAIAIPDFGILYSRPCLVLCDAAISTSSYSLLTLNFCSLLIMGASERVISQQEIAESLNIPAIVYILGSIIFSTADYCVILTSNELSKFAQH